jgi:glycosyltransferase involved in cell wall biosynthesis
VTQKERSRTKNLNKKNPYLSIIIPTKNEEGHLPRLLESIFEQTFKDFEVIIADANSTDRTREEALKYSTKIVPGGILSEGRNNGAKAAKGEILLFLDADTFLQKNDTLSRIVSGFEKNNFDFGSGFLIADSNKILNKVIYQGANLICFGSQKFDPKGYGGYMFSKTEIHNEIDGFRDVMPFEDQDYIRRAKKIGAKYKFLAKPSILVSTRRFDKEGIGHLTLKYVLLNLVNLKGKKKIKTDIVEYEFDIYKKSD